MQGVAWVRQRQLILVITVRRDASTVYAMALWLVGWSLTSLFSTNTAISETTMALCVVPICLSVCSSQVGVLSKQLNVSPRKQHHDSISVLVFWRKRSWRKFIGITLNRGAKYRWGRLTSAIFDHYLAIFQKRCM